jgi:hypothetical protein
MKYLLIAILIAVPLVGASEWQSDARRARADAMREASRARIARGARQKRRVARSIGPCRAGPATCAARGWNGCQVRESHLETGRGSPRRRRGERGARMDPLLALVTQALW